MPAGFFRIAEGECIAIAKARWDAGEATEVLELAVRNPYDPEVVSKRRELAALERWPRGANAWLSWWESLPVPLRTDESALIACFLGAPDHPGVVRAQAAVESRARNLLKDMSDSCAEVSSRALRVTASLDAIVGNTDVMRHVRRTCWAAAFGDRLDTVSSMTRLFQTTPVLIEGATGTGKELVAQALCLSMRGKWKRGHGWTPAVAESVHLASLPATLVDRGLSFTLVERPHRYRGTQGIYMWVNVARSPGLG